MVRERNATSAALVVAVITLSQWPVVNSSPLQLTIFSLWWRSRRGLGHLRVGQSQPSRGISLGTIVLRGGI
jgi:hypothetical protein